MRSDMEEPKEEAKHYVLEVQSATIRGTAKIEAPKEAEEKDDGESSS